VEFIPEATNETVSKSISLSSQWRGQRLFVWGYVSGNGKLLIRQVYVPGWALEIPHGDSWDVKCAEPFWQEIEVPSESFFRAQFRLGPVDDRKERWLALHFHYLPWAWIIGLSLFPIGLFGFLCLAMMGIKTKHVGVS
jgi:hypothetical protein